ncbi:hypothetical protein GCM10010912_17670 [Paenibacillus albidus]|uniref:Uncharacterized protein n=1 Tax=Paenibacillus albidus TaxID=2041023 RepID=A0A917FEX4_9BACL|nr:hypothetical protein [Paenibacillus albidus]GGF72933.1 hypothetical protein GCM10010912_17670 [Paenibacillus albidus]
MKKKEESLGDEQTEEVKSGEAAAPDENNGDSDTSGKSEQNEVQTAEITLKGVVLKGTDSQKIGPHTLFIGSRIVNFLDGKAEVQEDLAEELENGGYIE